MKTIMRFYDTDLMDIMMKWFNLKPEQITMNYSEEPVEGSETLTQPIFYIDIEEGERK